MVFFAGIGFYIRLPRRFKNKIMKKIIIVRHGDYSEIGKKSLSNLGKKQMTNLAKRLFPEIENKNIIFVSSMAPRAIESAQILKDIWKKNGLDLSFKKYNELWSGPDSAIERKRLNEEENKNISVQDFDWFKNFIKKSDCDVMVVVTHLEFVENFPNLCLGWGFSSISKYGSARILNLNIKSQSVIFC
jgi:hypothetical protein